MNPLHSTFAIVLCSAVRGASNTCHCCKEGGFGWSEYMAPVLRYVTLVLRISVSRVLCSGFEFATESGIRHWIWRKFLCRWHFSVSVLIHTWEQRLLNHRFAHALLHGVLRLPGRLAWRRSALNRVSPCCSSPVLLQTLCSYPCLLGR